MLNVPDCAAALDEQHTLTDSNNRIQRLSIYHSIDTMSELPPDPPSTGSLAARPNNDHIPEGTPAEHEKILSGLLPAGGLGQTISLAVPRLVHDFRLAANLERKIGLGQSCWGERNWIGICGGAWSATWGKGRIVVCFFFLFFYLFV